jgi:multidrug resistance efflux pump
MSYTPSYSTAKWLYNSNYTRSVIFRPSATQRPKRQQYELNSLQVQLAEVEVELGQVSAVRSPYSGTVKKVKVKGQTGNLMEVEVTVVPIANND